MGRKRLRRASKWEKKRTRSSQRLVGRGNFGFIAATVKRLIAWRIATVVMITAAALSLLVAFDSGIDSGKIHRGVSVGDIALGGKTPEEAGEILNKRSDTLTEIRLAGDDTDVTLTARQLGLDLDIEKTVRDAYAVGREGIIFERLSGRFGGEVRPEISYDPETIRTSVLDLAGRKNVAPQSASVSIRNGRVAVKEASVGYTVDQKATIENVEDAVTDLTGQATVVGNEIEPEIRDQAAEEAARTAREAMSSTVTLTAGNREWSLSGEALGDSLTFEPGKERIEVGLDRDGLRRSLSEPFGVLTIQPVEADYEISGTEVSVIPGKIGQRVEEEKLFDAMSAGIFEGDHSYEIPVVEARPELTTTEAREMKPTTLLGEYSTNYLTYDDSPGRVNNLEIASEAVNDTMLAPGEVFSFNALAEPLDYYETKVIQRGRVDTAEGGGLCQVSSTLYMAVNLAGLEPIERQPHYAELPYIRPGFDATIWFGAIDFKFRNNNDSYVLVKEGIDRSTGEVYSQIWGKPNGREVEMSSEKVGEWDDAEGNPATKWVTYKTVTENGEVVQDGVFHTDTYKYLKPEASSDRPPS